MIIFLYGKDTFRSRYQLKKMIEKFKADRDPRGYNVSRVDAASIREPGAIMEQILAVPFLAERRMIVIENLLVSPHHELQEEISARLTENRLPESNVIIIWEGADAFKTKIAKSLAERLAKEKFSQKFDELPPAGLNSWIMEEVKARGGDIAPAAIQYLAMHVGVDLWRLSSLIDQLVAYKARAPLLDSKNDSPPSAFVPHCGTKVWVAIESQDQAPKNNPPYVPPTRGESVIELADVKLFVRETADDDIFKLVDAVVAGQTKAAYSMIAEQYRQGEDAQYIFAMLLRQFRIFLQLRDWFERHDTAASESMAGELGLHPFVFKKSLPLVKRYTMADLKKVHHMLLDFDIHVKTGQGEDKVLLDVLVARLAVA